MCKNTSAIATTDNFCFCKGIQTELRKLRMLLVAARETENEATLPEMPEWMANAPVIYRSAGIFRERYSRNKPIVSSLPTIGSSSNAETAEVNHGHNKGETVTSGNSSETSEGKVTNSASNKQEAGAESSQI